MTTSALLDCLGNEQVTVTRFGKTKLVGGKHKASKMKPFRVVASVQPIKGREREFLPEGFNQRHVVRLYTETKLLLTDEKTRQRADLLTIDGEEFEVIMVETHKGLGLDHFKVYAARRDDK